MVWLNTLVQTLDLDAEGADAISEGIAEQLEKLEGMTPSQIWLSFVEFMKEFLPKLGWTLLVFVAGYLLILSLMRFLRRTLGKTKVEPTLHSFILASSKIVLMVLLSITCLGIMKVEITPLIAAVGALGLALSLAVQDTLSNVAGGISVLFSHPFTIGDYVDIGGTPGTITELGLVYTQLKTIDNKKVFLPNGDVAKATIVNYSAEPIRRLDITFPVRAASDFDRAKAIMLDVIGENNLALKDPAPVIRITDQTFAYVKMTAMVWSNTADLYVLNGQLIGEIRRRMAREDL